MELTKRQTEIIDAALRLTAEGGIQNLTIKNLAGALGITEPAIYRHFKNKSEIVKTMIGGFDNASAAGNGGHGFDAIAAFARSRFEQVAANPPLAKVMFAEELFMDDREFSELMLGMMHKHKNSLERHFIEAQNSGEIRNDISLDMLFRLVFGPVRLLVKQWGISNGAFPLVEKGDELLENLRKILR
ncbi:MAG: TetR/AcrR family transcriptional regulator [Victivallaceae bacterium]|nr:TetR/AcrR family transcriptional regulator [Victivallaceae bacterium]